MLMYLVYSNIFIHTVRLQDCDLNFNKHGMQVTLPNIVVLLVTMIFCLGKSLLTQQVSYVHIYSDWYISLIVVYTMLLLAIRKFNF